LAESIDIDHFIFVVPPEAAECNEKMGRGVKVGIADKKWGSNAACGPCTRKSGDQLTPWTPWLRGS